MKTKYPNPLSTETSFGQMWDYIHRQISSFRGGKIEALGPFFERDEADNRPVIRMEVDMTDWPLGRGRDGVEGCIETINFKIGPMGTVSITSSFTASAAMFAKFGETYTRQFVTAADAIRYFESPEAEFTKADQHFGGPENDPFKLTQCSVLAQHLACVRRG